MIPDYNVLDLFTVAEIDKIQSEIGANDWWLESEERHMLLRREQMEIDILEGTIDNKWGIPMITKAGRHRVEEQVKAKRE